MSHQQAFTSQTQPRLSGENAEQAAGELMERWYAAWSAHDLSAIAACLTEDAVLEGPSGAYRGHDAILNWAQSVFRASADFQLQMLEAWTTPGSAVMATYFKATGTFTGPYIPPGFAPTNGPIAFEGMDRNELRDSRIARHQIFYDTTAVARQIGAAPAQDTIAEKLSIRIQHLAARRLRKRAERTY